MVGVFALVALVGLVTLLFGGNTLHAGRIGTEEDARAQLLEGFRFAGRFYVWLGAILLAIGIVGMAITGLVVLLA